MSVKRISIYKVIENLVEHGRQTLSAMLHKIFNDYTVMFLRQWHHRSVATTALSNIFLSPLAECPDDVIDLPGHVGLR